MMKLMGCFAASNNKEIEVETLKPKVVLEIHRLHMKHAKIYGFEH